MDNYLYDLQRSMSQENSSYVAELMSLAKNPYLHVLSKTRIIPKIRQQIINRFQPLDEVVLCYLETLNTLPEGDIDVTYKCHNETVQAMVKIIQMQMQKRENVYWMLPVMNNMCLELRLLAMKAEKSRKSTESNEYLEQSAKCMLLCFRVWAASNRTSIDDYEKSGILFLVNQLLKVYYKTNKLDLCKPLVRVIDACTYMDKFSKAQVITYKFYLGRKAVFDDDYKTANEHLEFAFKHCHRNSKKNKQSILKYLIPIKMLLGYMPKYNLLEKYDLMIFKDMIEAVKKGDIQSVDEIMTKMQSFLINTGIYKIMHKVKMLAYRNLFKKVCLVLKTHQVDVRNFKCALEMYGQNDLDTDEVECLIVNLIGDRKINGYISHKHKTLVLSKKEPFPRLPAAN